MTTKRRRGRPEPGGEEPDLAAKRARSDATKQRSRERSSDERDRRRAVHDRTLHHQRGGRQERESLARERREDDAEIERERAVADELEREERGMTDAILSRRTDALVTAGREAAQERGDLQSRLSSALDEVERIESAAAALLQDERSDAAAAHLRVVVTSARRVHHLLRQALGSGA